MGEIHLRVLDRPIRLTGLPPEAEAAIYECFGAFVASAARDAYVVAVETTAAGWAVVAGGAPDGAPAATESSGLLLALGTAVNRHALTTTRHLAMHAGVVGHDGQAVALPAVSGAGKSTLVAAAVAAGLTYLSDESLCLDRADGSLVPYPKPLGLSAWSRRTLGLHDDDPAERLVPASTLGRAVTPDDRAYVLAHVVFPSVRPGPPELTPVPRSSMITGLLERSFNHFHDPRGSFRLLAAAAVRSRSWSLTYQDLDPPTQHLGALLTPGGQLPEQGERKAIW